MANKFKIGDVKVAEPVFLKKDGSVGRIDGDPQWSNSNDTVMSMVISDDKKTATITMLAEGTTQLSASGDADLGEGVRLIVAIGDIEVLPEEVVTARMDFRDPTS